MNYFLVIGAPQIIIVLLFFGLLLPTIALWKIFQKANQPGWASIVPIYNLIVFMRVIGKPSWWVILWLIPYVNIIFIIWGWNLMSKSFGRGVGFTLGVLFFGLIFIPILGFGDSLYLGPAGQNNTKE